MKTQGKFHSANGGLDPAWGRAQVVDSGHSIYFNKWVRCYKSFLLSVVKLSVIKNRVGHWCILRWNEFKSQHGPSTYIVSESPVYPMWYWRIVAFKSFMVVRRLVSCNSLISKFFMWSWRPSYMTSFKYPWLWNWHENRFLFKLQSVRSESVGRTQV